MRENTRGYRRKTVNLHVELVSDAIGIGEGLTERARLGLVDPADKALGKAPPLSVP
jgi:hypothetical protein